MTPDIKTDKQNSLFFGTIKKTNLVVNQTSAGAGVAGLLGFAVMFLVASLFFITENYFIAMLSFSFGLLIYVTGIDMAKILLSSFTIFFSSKHLMNQAAYLQETLEVLKKNLHLKRDKNGEIQVDSLAKGAALSMPNNPLVKELQQVLREGRDFDYAEYIAHSYYVECHELYDYSSANLDFVANAMPLCGLIGTIVGLIAMFDGLGADVTVESLSPQLALALKTTLYGAIFSSVYKIIGSRFEQRLRALDYDYDTFCRALQVITENKNTIEVEA